jgi:hypothetical protein
MGECQDVFIAVAPECYIIDALHIPTVCSKESDYLRVHVLVNEEASLLLERTERISVIFCEFKLFPWHSCNPEVSSIHPANDSRSRDDALPT